MLVIEEMGTGPGCLLERYEETQCNEFYSGILMGQIKSLHQHIHPLPFS